MEAGIGPICRDLDNALLARLIPSNTEAAKMAFEKVDLTAVAPETLKTLNEVYGAIYADGAAAREDWRIEVKRIEWALSYPANNYMRADLTGVVAALGYIGLAALWSGEAKSGKALVLFQTNRIFVQAAKCKAANITFRAIQGRLFHSAGTVAGVVKAAWSFPAQQHDATYLAVIKHYPNFDGLNAAIAQAKAFIAPAPKITIDTETVPSPFEQIKADPAFEAFSAATKEKIMQSMGIAPELLKPTVTVVVTTVPAPTPAPAPAPVKVASKCSITPVGVLLKVSTPYNAAFINDLKTMVKWSDRRWNAGEKVWEVTANYEAKMKGLLTKHYGVAL